MGMQICRRYVVLFLCLVMLTEHNEETMIFSKCVGQSPRQTDFLTDLFYIAYFVSGKNSPD